MLNKHIKNKSLLILVLFMFMSLAQAMDVYIGTMFSVTRKNILVTPFSPMSQSASSDKMNNLWDAVKYDLEFSGYFSVITLSRIPTKPDQPGFPDLGFLQSLNVEHYTQGGYILSGNRLFLEANLMDPKTGLREWGKKYQGDLGLHREMIHRFSDEIVNKVTGNKGIATSRIAFISKASGNKELYVMDYDGENVSRLTHDNSITLSPSWSPDKSEIAFVSYKDDSPSIYVINVNTKRTRKISGYKTLNMTPKWSPDGRTIAATLNKDGDENIYLLDPQGKASPRRLTKSPGIDISPSFSPDGSQIAFVSDRSGSPQIYVMNSDGTNTRRITFKGNYNSSPAWSPRGDWIAFVSQTSNGFDLCLIQPDGQNQTVVSTGYGSNEEPSWAPDGRHLVFSSSRTGSSEIYTFSFDGSGVRTLSKRLSASQPCWSN